MRTHIYIVLAALLAFPLQINGAPINLSIYGEKEEEQSASIHVVDSFSDASSDEALPLLTRAEDTVVSDSLEATMDSVVVAEDSVPEWYIPAEIPAELRAPMRANAGTCLTDSILTFNADSVLTEATTYDYDAAGRTIRTTVWQYNADGSRTGKSKQEYAFDANGTQIYTGTFVWDTNTNDWRGTAKSEFVYNEAHKMESNITYTWVNNTWLPSQALTYAYDAAGRETEFTTYSRNASANRLVPSKQRLQTWYNASKKTLEINYTAYSNGAWSAGNKKEYAYDSNGNQIEYTYYSSYSAGNWIGSTQEFWTYNGSNKKTLYEKYTFSNNAWSITTREITGYDAAGNTILVENYALKSGVLSGSKKEEYTFNASKKKTSTITYKWTNGEWVNNVWTVSGYDAAGNANETCKYNWKNNAWVGTGNRTLKTYNSSKKVTEQITQSWSTTDNDWINVTRATTDYAGTQITQEATFNWVNEAWVGTSRSDYHFNAAGQNDTIKTYTNNGTDWLYSARTVNTYDSLGNNILTHNASWNDSAWIMTSMNRLDMRFDSANRQILNATWRCGSDSSWIGIQKDTAVYSATGKTLFSAHYQSWANNDWVPVYKFEYAYDEADRTILIQRLDWISNSWQGHYRNEYAYDEQGRQITNAYYGTWNSTLESWVGTYKNDYVYDDNGLCTQNIMYTWRNNQWQNLLLYTYLYDNSKREIEQFVYQYDSNAGWISYQKYIKEYENNRQVKNNSYIWLNNDWSFMSQEETYYDNNAQAKIRREVIGSWNNGIEQSFSDNHYFYSCDAPASNGSQPRTPTEIEEIDENNENYENNENNAQPFDPTQPTYNLSGQRIDPAGYHGLVIQSGHTYLLP